MHRILIAGAVLLAATSTAPAQFLGKNNSEWGAELRTGSEPQRRNAAFALGKMEGQALQQVGALKKAVADPSPKVREAAAYALGEIGLKQVSLGKDADLQTVLVEALRKDSDAHVRRSAAFALGCLGADAARARTVVETALDDKDPAVRQSAAWALGRLGDESIPALSRALKDQDPLVLRDAALSLGQLDPKASRIAVDDLARLATYPDAEVKKAALFALVSIVKPVDAKSGSITAPVQKALLDGDEEVRRNAAFALSNIGGPTAAPAVDVLMEALRNGEVEIKRQAAAAFGNIGPAADRAVPELIACLKVGDPELRSNAVLALGGIGPRAEAAVTPLVGIVANRKDPAADRSAAAVALSKIGDVKSAVAAVPKLLAVVSDPTEDGKVRERVMWALRVHNINLRELPGVSQAFRKILVERSTQENRMVRQDCAYLTGMLYGANAPPEVFPVLLEYLKDDSLQVYRDTATLVGGTAQETTTGKTSTRELGEGDGRKLALDALTAIGPAVVREQAAIVAQIRRLADGPRLAPSFRQQCREYLKTLE